MEILSEFSLSSIEINERLNALEKLYNQMLDIVTNNINLYWAILFGVMGVIGVALYFIASQAVEKGVKKGVEEVKNKFLNESKQQQEKLTRFMQESAKETGTWTPEVNSEYNCISSMGKYTQSNNMVILWFVVVLSKKPDQQKPKPIQIKGLPFVLKNEPYFSMATVTYQDSEDTKFYKGNYKTPISIVINTDVASTVKVEGTIIHEI